jgi:5-methylcytosine-specific restriction endonuclease McrA
MDTAETILARIDVVAKEVEAVRLAGDLPEDVETIVQRLGYKSYKHYLRSPLWLEEIRPRVLQRDNHICYRCGETAKEVHHRHYTEKAMKGEDDPLLVSLCARCHNTVEFGSKGRRRSHEEKLRVLEAKIDRTVIPEPYLPKRLRSRLRHTLPPSAG